MMQQNATTPLLLRPSSLPTPAQGVSKLIASLSDDELPFSGLARAIEIYPSIVARLIALANSGWSSPVNPISSLEQACARLGFNVVRSVSIALAISAPFNPARCSAFDSQRFWCSAFLCANSAYWLSHHVDDTDRQMSRTAGLLYNIGLLWLAEALPEKTSRALQLAMQDDEISTNDALLMHCGIGYDQAGALLAENWSLPVILRDVMARHREECAPDEAETLVCIAGIASRMVRSVLNQSEYSFINTRVVSENLQAGILERLQKGYPETMEMAVSLSIR